jgi:CheY-like chemotaxis protein
MRSPGERPDLVLSDIAMPHETGLDLIRRIRAFGPEAGGNVPAIALTAYTPPELLHRIQAAGFELYIAKPVAPTELCARLATFARSHGATAGRR